MAASSAFDDSPRRADSQEASGDPQTLRSHPNAQRPASEPSKSEEGGVGPSASEAVRSTAPANSAEESTGDVPAQAAQPHGGEAQSAGNQTETAEEPRRRILIGSQRDPARYRPSPIGRSVRIVGVQPKTGVSQNEEAEQPSAEGPSGTTDQASSAALGGPAETQSGERAPDLSAAASAKPQANAPGAGPDDLIVAGGRPSARQQTDAPETAETSAACEPDMAFAEESLDLPPLAAEVPVGMEDVDLPAQGFPPPRLPSKLGPDLEEELEEALGGVSLDELMASGQAIGDQPMLEPDSTLQGRIVMVHQENVFVDLGQREQGVLSIRQFDSAPELGALISVRVVRFNAANGLYELALPTGAANIANWLELEQGMIVEVRVTGCNTGGLECEVNHIRGFIPISQISLYRVETPEEYVGQKLSCLVIEVNPERRRLVLSRRALLEREREQARRELLESLQPGQVREGTVRKLADFGAFVDLGGVDGLLHVSRMGWGRVENPAELFQPGQRIQVKIISVDQASQRISLSYRELVENPWDRAAEKYRENEQYRGRVTRLAEYGAFVELEPGVEGLVHISELSHKKVWRVSDVVEEGDEVDVVVLGVDPQQRRISLSMKHLTAPAPEPKAPEENAQEPQPGETPSPAKPKKDPEPRRPLKGGLGRSPGGAQFGLKW